MTQAMLWQSLDRRDEVVNSLGCPDTSGGTGEWPLLGFLARYDRVLS